MKNKSERLLVTRKLIRNERIASQEELLKKLENVGFSMTQATLSRDLKYLRASKVYDPLKGMVYSLPDMDQNSTGTMNSFLSDGFVSFEFAQGMGILKTLPGYASGIASALDAMNLLEVAGTIAGDDTILLIPRDGTNKEDLNSQLSILFRKSIK